MLEDYGHHKLPWSAIHGTLRRLAIHCTKIAVASRSFHFRLGATNRQFNFGMKTGAGQTQTIDVLSRLLKKVGPKALNLSSKKSMCARRWKMIL
jgi:hypothetical protein